MNDGNSASERLFLPVPESTDARRGERFRKLFTQDLIWLSLEGSRELCYGGPARMGKRQQASEEMERDDHDLRTEIIIERVWREGTGLRILTRSTHSAARIHEY
ncbi:hypothetical protein Moror_4019 [Moniliophthora roreri MCA 2997]|uniref:Uncharacterized protein n=1 Tax=Moniliophthora roreri (strain MCA 2997) TaxID=1381753 RepID=V2XQY2_MONRO|nr:hypothetical protein Moror_4019 [Moniliophthora roreri MCA 2997]